MSRLDAATTTQRITDAGGAVLTNDAALVTSDFSALDSTFAFDGAVSSFADASDSGNDAGPNKCTDLEAPVGAPLAATWEVGEPVLTGGTIVEGIYDMVARSVLRADSAQAIEYCGLGQLGGDEAAVVRLTLQEDGLWNWEQVGSIVDGVDSAEIRGTFSFQADGYLMRPIANTPICHYMSLNAGAEVLAEEKLEDGRYDEPLITRYSVSGDTLTTFYAISSDLISSDVPIIYCYAKHTFKRRQ